MTFKSLLAAGLAFAVLALPVAAYAQDASSSSAQPAATDQAAPAPGDKTQAAAANPQGNWLKICAPNDDPSKRACIMRQLIVTPNNQFLGSFFLRDDPSQQSRLLAVAAVPVGVMLPFGMTWQIDNGKPVRVPYLLCDPRSCSTQLVINEAYVNSLKKGSKLTLTAKNQQNKDIVITFDLSGFTNVYDSDASISIDEYNKNTNGEAALEKTLQDRAEALRQKLNGGGTDASSSSSSSQAPTK